MFQKKKEVLPEPEPLTESDIKKLKEKLTAKDIHKNEEEELVIKDLGITDLIPQAFKEITITLEGGSHCVNMADGMNQDKYKTFRKSKGGIFSRDALAYTRGKEYGKYLLIEGNGDRKVVRIIEDEELLLFQTLKLINGIIKDKPYMLLKNLEEGQELTGTTEYIKKNSEQEDLIEEEIMVYTPTSIELEDDHESVGSSVSLFDE